MDEMREYDDFAKRMEEEYPAMFAGAYGGFAVGKGWWPIIEVLCANIQQHIDWANRKEQVVEQVVVAQVKEKFGGLRFYYDGGDEQVHGMVRIAEAWANRTCETCCERGKQRGGGWIRTLCDKHEAEYQTRKNSND
jgi:hypothetical protein